MQKVRRLAAVVVMTVAAIAIGLWLMRDQPRRIVQSALAERLGAEVSVGSLHIEGLYEVRLGQVVIRMRAAPGLREIRIDEIVARGALGEMSRGRFQSLRLVGVEVIVDPAAGAVWPTDGGPQMESEVARLEIAAGRVTLLSPDGDSDIDFTADLNDVGIVPTGTVTFTGDRLQLDPLLQLAGLEVPDRLRHTHADSLAGELRLAADGPRFALSAGVDRISLADRPIDAVARLEGTVIEEAPGVVRVVLVPSLPSVGEGRIEATLATSPWRVTQLRALANGIDAAAWSPAALDLPPGWSVVGGTIDLEVGGEPARGLAIDVTAHDLDIAGSLPLRGNLAGKGEVRINDGGAPTGRIELTGRITKQPTETAPSTVLDAVLPTTFAAKFELPSEGRPVSGSVRLATAAAGVLDVTGTAALEPPAPLDARWTWSGGDLEPLVDLFAADAAASIPEGLVVAGEVAASGRLGGNLTAPTVSGEVWIRDLAVRSGGGGRRGSARLAALRRAPGRPLCVDAGETDDRTRGARHRADRRDRSPGPGAGRPARVGDRGPGTRRGPAPAAGRRRRQSGHGQARGGLATHRARSRKAGAPGRRPQRLAAAYRTGSRRLAARRQRLRARDARAGGDERRSRVELRWTH